MSAEQTPDPVPPRTRTGEIIRESRNVGMWVTSLTPNQIMTVMVVVLMVFVCGMYGYFFHFATRQAVEMRNAEIRSSSEREEMIRQHCAIEREKDRQEAEKVRAFFAAQLDSQRRHDDDASEKLRVIITSIMERMSRLELTFTKWKN